MCRYSYTHRCVVYGLSIGPNATYLRPQLVAEQSDIP